MPTVSTVTVNVDADAGCPCCGGSCTQDVCCTSPTPADTLTATIENFDCNSGLDGQTGTLTYQSGISFDPCTYADTFTGWAGSVTALGVTIHLFLHQCTGPCCDGDSGYRITGCCSTDGVLSGGLGESESGGVVLSCSCDPFELEFGLLNDSCVHCDGKGLAIKLVITL